MSSDDYAIVFSGGGALAAWEVGCYSAICSRHNGRLPKVVTGASAGALNAVGVCCGMSSSDLGEFWRGIDNSQVFRMRTSRADLIRMLTKAIFSSDIARSIRNSLNETKSVFDNSPLYDTLRKILNNRFNDFMQSDRSCAISLTNLSHNRREIFYKIPVSAEVPEMIIKDSGRMLWNKIASLDHLLQALLGSTALPVLFPAKEGYFDGGILLNQPISPAVDLGANSIYVLIPSARALGDTEHLFSVANSLMATWLSSSLFVQIENIKLRNYLRRLSGDKLIKVCIVRPPSDFSRDLGISILTFGAMVDEMIELGIKAANARLNTFIPSENHEATWYDAGE